MDHSLESQEIDLPFYPKSQNNLTNYYYASNIKQPIENQIKQQHAQIAPNQQQEDQLKRSILQDLKQLLSEKDLLYQQLIEENEKQKQIENDIKNNLIDSEQSQQNIQYISIRKQNIKKQINNLQLDMQNLENILTDFDKNKGINQNHSEIMRQSNVNQQTTFNFNSNEYTQLSPGIRNQSLSDIKKVRMMEQKLQDQNFQLQRLSLENNILENQLIQQNEKSKSSVPRIYSAKTLKKSINSKKINKKLTEEYSQSIQSSKHSEKSEKQKKNKKSSINSSTQYQKKELFQFNLNQLTELQQQIKQLEEKNKQNEDERQYLSNKNKELYIIQKQQSVELQEKDNQINQLIEKLKNKDKQLEFQQNSIQEQFLSEKEQLLNEITELKMQQNCLISQHTEELQLCMEKLTQTKKQEENDKTVIQLLQKERDQLQQEIRALIQELTNSQSMLINISNFNKSTESYDISGRSESIQKSFVENEYLNIIKQFKKENDNLTNQLKKNLKHNLELEKKLEDTKNKSNKKQVIIEENKVDKDKEIQYMIEKLQKENDKQEKQIQKKKNQK